DLLKSNSSRLLLASGDGMDFQALLVDEDRAWLMVGAKNHIFLLHLDHPSREPEKIFWPASKEQVEHCQLAGKDMETECANFIRLLQPFNRSHVFACGTGSHQQLTSSLWLWQGPGTPPMRLVTHSLESGRGRCPYSPHEPFTGLLIDGELYSGTSSDFMGSSAAFFRTWVHGAEQSYIRTEQNQDHWLHEPAFVGAYAIPDTYNPHDDKVYIFFRETAMEAGQWERRHIHARVARVCKVSHQRPVCHNWVQGRPPASPGPMLQLLSASPPPLSLQRMFSSCAPGTPRTPLSSASSRSPGERGSGQPLHGAVQPPSPYQGGGAGRAGLALTCAPPQPRVATQCPSETYDPLLQSTKDFPDEVISFMRTHQLMWEPVYPQGLRRALPRHRWELTPALGMLSAPPSPAAFTDEGKVLKVGLASGVSHGTEVISLEEISVTKV
ncbi:Semaphorin-3D, partial [Balearica regulorum gibbericeps]